MAQADPAAHVATFAAVVAAAVLSFEDRQAPVAPVVRAAPVAHPDRPIDPSNASAAAAVAVADAHAAVIAPAIDAVVIAAISGARNPRRTCRRESTST